MSFEPKLHFLKNGLCRLCSSCILAGELRIWLVCFKMQTKQNSLQFLFLGLSIWGGTSRSMVRRAKASWNCIIKEDKGVLHAYFRGEKRCSPPVHVQSCSEFQLLLTEHWWYCRSCNALEVLLDMYVSCWYFFKKRKEKERKLLECNIRKLSVGEVRESQVITCPLIPKSG